MRPVFVETQQSSLYSSVLRKTGELYWSVVAKVIVSF